MEAAVGMFGRASKRAREPMQHLSENADVSQAHGKIAHFPGPAPK